MKFIIIAGTPGSGKTSTIVHVIKELISKKKCPSVIKIDCLWTEDDQRIKKLNIPVKIGLSKDMCPDHFFIYNIESMFEWAKKNKSDVLIVETAGLCLRCAPYTKESLSVCVIDVTSGPNTPLKIGPLLTEADIVVTTKGDMVSQAEREVFRERIMEANPNCNIIESNGITGKGSYELLHKILNSSEFLDIKKDMVLRCNPPFSICTLCAGEKKVGKEYHCGLLRNMEDFNKYVGE